VQPNAFYPGGGIQGIMLDGADVTGVLRGGQIGANIALRDTTLPTDQAELTNSRRTSRAGSTTTA
jgi:flagellar hook-associated protein 1 FlgK